MRLLIATDAWFPQVNGVVRTLNAVAEELRKRNHEVLFISPESRRSLPMPFYNEIRLSLAEAGGIGREIDALAPQAIQIATEGPLGWAARRACLRRKVPFTTGFHARFADYAAARLPLPGIARAGWAALRRFHRPSKSIMVPTPTLARELAARGFENVRVWTRGVDRSLFKPGRRDHLDLPRPILLFSGRVAIEKNIEDFLKLRVAGTKVVLGDGPQRRELEANYPAACFLGYRHGEDYARTIGSADVLVFPSRTDTFGLVMLEAMACGTPVTAYNVASPIDVIEDGISGALEANLETAVRRALKLDRTWVHEAAAAAFTWERTAEMFLSWLAPINPACFSQPLENAGLVHLR